MTFTPQDLEEAIDASINTPFMYFSDEVSRHGNSLPYCFVEGYDRPYYQPRVEAWSKKSSFIPCGNKKNVIKLNDFVSKRHTYNNLKKLYFVDKDYDENSTLSGEIFVTDGYSVENYYCSENFIEKFSKAYLRNEGEEGDKETAKILADFNLWHTNFFNATHRFCAWYFHARNATMGDDRGKDYKQSFPPRYAEITKDGINDKGYTLDTMNSDYQLTPEVTTGDHENAKDRIISSYDIRGKYVLQFIEAYIEHLVKVSSKKGTFIKKGFQFQKDRPTFMLRMSACADVSDRLLDYLKSNLL